MISFSIGQRLIGRNAPVFVVAEAGVNHAGSFQEAEKMVEIAAACQADAVSFQHIAWDEINSAQLKGKTNAAWDSWRLSDEQMVRLFERAHALGLAVTACVADFAALRFIVRAGADFLKIVSGDLTCHPFLAACARTGLPVFLSTGNALLPEIEAAVQVIEKAGGSKIVIYHTNSKYPTPPDEVNLRAMEVLRRFNYPVGFCDHTAGPAVCLAAAALGARVVEKHFSLDPTVKRPDHEVSIGPQELGRFISELRDIGKAVGQPVKRRNPDEDYLAVRRSIYFDRDLPQGHRLQWDDLAYKRPGTGIPPTEAGSFAGKILSSPVRKGEPFLKNMLEPPEQIQPPDQPLITIVVVCRLKSTRLPRKALLPVHGIPAIERCLLNCLAAPEVDRVVLATSDLPEDDPLADFTLSGRVKIVRGDPDNVAERMLQAAILTKASVVLRVTGDNPAVSPEIISRLIEAYRREDADYTYPLDCPMGTGADVISVKALRRLLHQPKPLTHTEYLSLYFINNPEMFSINPVKLPPEFQHPAWRLTMDEPADLALFEEIYRGLDVGREPLFFSRLCKYLLANPQLLQLNAGIATKWKNDVELVEELEDATLLK